MFLTHDHKGLPSFPQPRRAMSWTATPGAWPQCALLDNPLHPSQRLMGA